MLSSVEDVGRRVVIRYRLRDESERWVYTDVLGVLESWTVTEHGEVLTVRQRDGATVTVPASDVVAGKPIPASTRGRPPATGPGLARFAALGLPAVTTEALGDWLLQASEGFTRRANAVVSCGSPGVDTDQAITRVLEFYAEHGLSPTIQVVDGTPIEGELTARGWVPLEGEPTATQVVRIRDLERHLQSSTGQAVAEPATEPSATEPAIGPPATEPGVEPAGEAADQPSVELGVQLDERWLALYGRGSATSNAVRRVLTGPVSDGAGGTGAVTLARVTDPEGALVAIARGAVTGPWLGLSTLTVAESHRRRGIAGAILRALVDWSAQHGAGWAYLQVGTDNLDALRLYEGLGFRTDHTYRYYVPPAASR